MSAKPTLLLLTGAFFLLRFYFDLSPFPLMLLMLLFVCVMGGKNPASMEHFVPVYSSGLASDLAWGVAAVQGRRPYMEDMHLVVPFEDSKSHPDASAAAKVGLTHFFAVFDGHGGKRAAQFAHQKLVDNLLHFIRQGDSGSKQLLERASVQAFLRTDNDFLKVAIPRQIPDGSTGITCMVQQPAAPGEPRRLLVANLGDSRACMVRTDGTAEALSDDHKPNRPDEKARVQAAGGQVVFAGCWRVQGDLAVSRAFGDCHLKRFGVSAEPELSRFTLSSLDAFCVLASDGLWDVIDEQQCANALLRAQNPLDGARTLCDLASARGSMDNITVLVVDIRPRS